MLTFQPLNVGLLFTVQCYFQSVVTLESPIKALTPQHGATYHMSRSGSQGKREGGRDRGPLSVQCVIHIQEKHFQLPKCHWTITVGCLMHWSNMRALGSDDRIPITLPPFLGCAFGDNLKPGVSERTVKVPMLGGQSPSTRLTFNSSSLLPSQNHIFICNSQQPPIHHALCDCPLLACQPL